MARCSSCSAPLLSNSQLCRYCGVRNDMNLHALPHAELVDDNSARICPNCKIELQTIDLNLDGEFLLERCEQCFGLFFDTGELEILLEKGTSHANEINHEQLANVIKDRYQSDREVRYRKCPVCQSYMRRTNFGKRSGVIIDVCRHHGIWLDNGELIHLLEWKKSGGAILHEESRQSASSSRYTGSNNPYSAEASVRGEQIMARERRQYQTNQGPPDLEELIGNALSSLADRFFR